MKHRIYLLFLSIVLASSCVNNSLQPDVVNRSDALKEQYVVFGTISDAVSYTHLRAHET